MMINYTNTLGAQQGQTAGVTVFRQCTTVSATACNNNLTIDTLTQTATPSTRLNQCTQSSASQ